MICTAHERSQQTGNGKFRIIIHQCIECTPNNKGNQYTKYVFFVDVLNVNFSGGVKTTLRLSLQIQVQPNGLNCQRYLKPSMRSMINRLYSTMMQQHAEQQLQTLLQYEENPCKIRDFCTVPRLCPPICYIIQYLLRSLRQILNPLILLMVHDDPRNLTNFIQAGAGIDDPNRPVKHKCT